MNPQAQIFPRTLFSSQEALRQRQKRIQELRDAYFRALETENLDERLRILEEAQEEQIELFSDIPLSDIREMEAFAKLAREIEKHKALLFGVGSGLAAGGVAAAAGALQFLKELDLQEMQKKLDDLKNISQEASSLQSQIQTQEQQIHQALAALEQRKKELIQMEIVDKLLLLRTMSTTDYDARARQIVLELERTKSQHAGLIEKELSDQIAEARTKWEMWSSMPWETKELLRRFDEALQKGEDISDEDAKMFAQVKGDHPVILRMRAQWAQSQGLVLGENEDQKRQDELVRSWWTEWRNMKEGMASRSSPHQRLPHSRRGMQQAGRGRFDFLEMEKKLNRLLEEIRREGEQMLAQRQNVTFQQVFIDWQRRVAQAQEMARTGQRIRQALDDMRRPSSRATGTLPHTPSGSSGMRYAQTSSYYSQRSQQPQRVFHGEQAKKLLDTLDNWRKKAEPEVYWLFHEAWITLMEDVMRNTWISDKYSQRYETLWERMKPSMETKKREMDKKFRQGDSIVRQFAATSHVTHY